MFFCLLIIRMHLYGQVLACVNELDKQRKLVAETLVIIFSYKFIFQLCGNFTKCTACIRPVCSNTLAAFNPGYFPALAYMAARNIPDVLEAGYLVAAP